MWTFENQESAKEYEEKRAGSCNICACCFHDVGMQVDVSQCNLREGPFVK